MAANKPYVVTFDHAAVPGPGDVDHSQSSPGPERKGVNRAGYTVATLKKKLVIDWDTGRPKADGSVPLFAKSVTASFALDPISVAVSSDYPQKSRPYQVTLKHEIDDHAKSYIAIFLSFQDAFVTSLNTILFPTEKAPQWVPKAAVESRQEELANRVGTVIKSVSKQIVDAMNADREAKDSPEAYAAIYKQCTPQEWRMKKK